MGEYGFFHPDRGYWQAVSTPCSETIAEYPAGTIEVPLKPSAWHEWTGSGWADASDPEAEVAEWRTTRVMSRLEFARALMAINLLTHEQAMGFIRYEPLPEPITALIATLPEEYRADAEFEMQGARDFPRANAMWDLLCASEGWPEQADVDALFGWVG